mgnify:FL=1
MTISKNYYEQDGWNLSTINEAAEKEPEQFVKRIECSFKAQIEETADYVIKKQPECKILMIAGPSSSGKTTVANMIKAEFAKRNIWSTVISLDDFYIGIDKLPILKNGSKDFESINGLDTFQIKQTLKSIIYDGLCDMPIYDFSKMAPSNKRRHIKVPSNGMIIIEGLHALNPIISDGLPIESVLKIYVSVQNKVMFNGHEFISPEDIRLTRRVLRDYNYRDTMPIRTVMMWADVCRGEQLYIKPFEMESNISINSFHAYEICVMSKEMLGLMGSIPKNIQEYEHIVKLTEKLREFKNINKSLVTSDSLIREFIK